MSKEKRGPGVVKQPGPQRPTAKIKRLIHDRKKELDSQEARLFLKFAESYPSADLTLHVAEGIWTFIQFLKKNGYLIIHGKDVFSIPFNHIARWKHPK